MLVIIDHFDGRNAVVELPDLSMLTIDRRFIPDAKEGDLVKIEIDHTATALRKDKMEMVLKKLWRK